MVKRESTKGQIMTYKPEHIHRLQTCSANEYI
jgi:hypothetical protein